MIAPGDVDIQLQVVVLLITEWVNTMIACLKPTAFKEGVIISSR